MYNKIIFVGRLTRDVELRYLPSGSALATLGLASSHTYNKQDGTKAEETCFVDVKMFGRTAEIANQYLKKGSLVLIEGRLTFESWSDQNGQKRSKHTITAEAMKMFPKSQGGGNAEYGDYQRHDSAPATNAPRSSAPKRENKPEQVPDIDIDDDEIPF